MPLKPAFDKEHPEWQFDFEVGFYFTDPYRATHVERVLGSVPAWFADEPMTARFLRVPPGEATYHNVGEGEHPGFSHEISVAVQRSSLSELNPHLQESYFKCLYGTFAADRRPLRLCSSVDPEGTMKVTAYLGLDWREEDHGWPRFFDELGGLDPFLDALDHADPFWAGMAVENRGPSLGSLLWGGTLHDFGYYGSRFLAIVGKDAFKDALEGCPKVEWLPSSGVFVCWPWESYKLEDNAAYIRFMKVCAGFEMMLLREIWGKSRRRQARIWPRKQRDTAGGM